MCSVHRKEQETKKKRYAKKRKLHCTAQFTENLSVLFLRSEMLLKYTIMFLFHVRGVSCQFPFEGKSG